MLQTVATWLLKDYVGEYVENFNVDQLSIGYGIFSICFNLFILKCIREFSQIPQTKSLHDRFNYK